MGMLTRGQWHGGYGGNGSEWRSFYAGKFCFGYSKTADAGHYTLYIDGAIKAGPPTSMRFGNVSTSGRFFLFVYDDEQGHWDEKNLAASCEEQKRVASSVVDLTSLDGRRCQRTFTTNIRQTIRPRFWYFAFANCGAEVVGALKYEIHAENQLTGGDSEFSIDKNGSLQLHVGSAGLFVTLGLVLILSLRCSPGSGRCSWRTIAHRPFAFLLLVSMLLSACGDSLLAVHYNDFSQDGVGMKMLEVGGTLLVSLARATLAVLLLMIARGWYVSNVAYRNVLLTLLAMVVLVTVSAELYGEFIHEYSTTLYLYEGPTGVLILFLNTLFFVEAFRSMMVTYTKETSDEMKQFYKSVSLACFIFFLSLPASCILAVVFPPWVRAKYVARIEVAARFVSAALLTYCLWPSHLDIMIHARLEDRREEAEKEQDELGELQSALQQG